MNEIFTETLYKLAPKLYSSRTLPASQSCMCYGFSCGDGWNDVLTEISIGLEALNNQGADITAAQVKEKFGSLRFHCDYGENTTKEQKELSSKIVNDACAKAYSICEDCGEPGKLRNTAWRCVMCEPCYLKQMQKEKEKESSE